MGKEKGEKMSNSITLDELRKLVGEEYRKMLDRWEKGDLYFHTKEYLSKYTRAKAIHYNSMKLHICSVLALSRLGLPISTTFHSWLTGYHINKSTYILEHLAGYGILQPREKASGKMMLRDRGSGHIRQYKLSPNFIKSVYLKLTEGQ